MRTVRFQTGSDITVTVWSLASRRKVREHKLNAGQFAHASLSPDGTLVAAASNRYGDKPKSDDIRDKTRPVRIRVWETATGKIKHTLFPGVGHSDMVSMAFSPAGDRLVFSGGARDRRITILDLRNGRRVFAFHEPGFAVAALAFSPRGRRLASGGMSQFVRV